MTKFEELVRRGKLEIHYQNGRFDITHLVQLGIAKSFYFAYDPDLTRALREIWDQEEYLFLGKSGTKIREN